MKLPPIASFTRQSGGSCGSEAATPGRSAAMTDCGASARSTMTSLGHGPLATAGTMGSGAGEGGAFHEPNAVAMSGVSSACVTSPTQTSVARSGRQEDAYRRLTSSSVIAFALCGVPSQGWP